MTGAPLALSPIGSDAENRRRRRELIRAHHPDLGGDPAVFIEVLRSLDEGVVPERYAQDVRFAKRRRWWLVAIRPRPFRRHRPTRVL